MTTEGKNIQVRAAALSDADQLARIQVDSYRTAYRALLPADYLAVFTYEEQEEDWKALLPTTADQVLLVADIQGELVGYTYGQRADFGAYDCEFVALHVREIYQRQGIGSRLIRELAQTFVDLACNALFLWVLSENPAIELYTRLGGKLIGKKTWGNNQYFDSDVEETAIGWSDIKILLD